MNIASHSAVSVVVPVYNAEAYLRDCVKSVVSQTYEDVELVLVDDGSPDNSGKICDELAGTNSRIKVIHKKNGGVTSARKVGVESASGEWIFLLDADDMLAQKTLEILVKIADVNHDLDLVGCGYSPNIATIKESVSCGGTHEFTPLGYAVELANFNVSALWGKLIKRTVLLKSGALDVPEDVKMGEDLVGGIRLAKAISRAAQTPFVGYFYRQNLQSVSYQPKKNLDWRYKVLELIDDAVGPMPKEWARVWQLVAEVYLLAEVVHGADFNPSRARERALIERLRNCGNTTSQTKICLRIASIRCSFFRNFVRSALRVSILFRARMRGRK